MQNRTLPDRRAISGETARGFQAVNGLFAELAASFAQTVAGRMTAIDRDWSADVSAARHIFDRVIREAGDAIEPDLLAALVGPARVMVLGPLTAFDGETAKDRADRMRLTGLSRSAHGWLDMSKLERRSH